tara:strand:- start:9 stop:911 length:903 start_codon:yes stop_codon:yes gene_type:complete
MISNNQNSKTSIGFIGLGAIGLPIASNLIKAGFSMKVHTRSRKAEKNKELLGAKPSPNPKDSAKGSDYLLICVSDDKAVEKVLFGKNGANKGLKKGAIVIDLSTISPDKARAFESKLAQQGVIYIDAPVSGGTEGAQAATLTIFLGTNNKTLKVIDPILNSIAKEIYTFGSVGKGQEVKAINQILVAGTYVALAEAISLGEELNLPMKLVIQALEKGAAGSWALTHRSKSMLQDKYPLGFKLQLHYKDLSIALKTARKKGLKLSITSKVKKIEESLIKEGYKNDDVSVLKRFIKKRSKLT